MNFQGTDQYVATKELQIAVNAAIKLQKPLLVLAHEIAKSLDKKLITWHIKSTTLAQQGLYEYDAVSRLRDSQLGSVGVEDIANYIKKGKLWEAFDSDEQMVLLIDEIDKADIEFPNDLLLELDKMEFYCYELQKTIKARTRPIVIITSNNEKELPDAFLRRCLFHFIAFPEKETMQEIVKVHYPDLAESLVLQSMRLFYELREVRGIKKRPSTSELIDWIQLLISEGASADKLGDLTLHKDKLPHLGALLKNEQDVDLLNKPQKGFRY